MKEFFKENGVLIAGLSLPLIMALLFAAIQFFSSITVATPNHSVIFTTGNNYNNAHKVYVEDNRVLYSFQNPNSNQNSYYLRTPKVFVYNANTNELTELNVPVLKDNTNQSDLLIKDFGTQEIFTSLTSPDGYTFEYERYRNRSFMSEIFVGGYKNSVSIKKGSRSISIPQENNYRYYDAKFLGWVRED